MLIMEPNGSIEPATTTASASDSVELALDRVLAFSDNLGHEISNEIRALVDAKLATIGIRHRPAPNAPVWSMAG